MKIQRFDIHNFANCERQMKAALENVIRTPEIEDKIENAIAQMSHLEEDLPKEAKLFFEAILYGLITQEEFISVMRTRTKLPITNIFM